MNFFCYLEVSVGSFIIIALIIPWNWENDVMEDIGFVMPSLEIWGWSQYPYWSFIPIPKLRQSHNYLAILLGIPIAGKMVFYIKAGFCCVLLVKSSGWYVCLDNMSVDSLYLHEVFKVCQRHWHWKHGFLEFRMICISLLYSSVAKEMLWFTNVKGHESQQC